MNVQREELNTMMQVYNRANEIYKRQQTNFENNIETNNNKIKKINDILNRTQEQELDLPNEIIKEISY